MSSHFRKKYLILLSTLILLIGCSQVKAESASTIDINPTSFIIQENDLGKSLTILIKNTGATELKISATECLAIKDSSTQQLSLSPEKVGKSVIIIENPKLNFKANSSASLITRIKISATGGSNLIPCILLTNEGASTAPLIIPYYIQDFAAEQKMALNLDIDKGGLVTSSNLQINGSISNTGKRFFIPQGKLLINKDGKLLSEIDITNQIQSLLMPGDKKEFSLNWNNDLQNLASIGEYTIEAKITTDQSSKVSVSKLVFTYIPSDYIIASSVILAAILLIIIGIAILKKKKT